MGVGLEVRGTGDDVRSGGIKCVLSPILARSGAVCVPANRCDRRSFAAASIAAWLAPPGFDALSAVAALPNVTRACGGVMLRETGPGGAVVERSPPNVGVLAIAALRAASVSMSSPSSASCVQSWHW